MELRLDATPEELPIFIAETDEMLQMLDEQLVRLEHDGPRPELLEAEVLYLAPLEEN